MSINLKKFGKRIAIRRTELGISQKELAELVCLSATHLSNIENGKSTPSFNTFVDLCDTLKTSADYFLCGAVHPDVSQEIMSKIQLCSDNEREKVSQILDIFIK